MANMSDSLANAYGPFVEPPATKSGAVGTTPTKVVSGSTGGRSGMRLVEVTNLHDSQALAYGLATAGGAAPSITATGAATDGGIILAGTSKVLPVRKDLDLYLVGAAEGTGYNVVVKDR